MGQTGKTLIGTVGKSVVKEVAQDTLVGAASSKAGNLVMNLTGDANLSRLAGLGTGILSGSKTGKALNSIDSAVSSSVKTLNHIDDVADVSKIVDDVSVSSKMAGDFENTNQFLTKDPYMGVKQASEYLKEQGVPRLYRKQILESFDARTIELKTADDSTYGIRFYGGNASAEGRYLFETFTSQTNRQNLALPYEWNSMTGIQQFQVSPGTTMLTGNAAAQIEYGSQYVGGAKQWYINNLEDIIK